MAVQKFPHWWNRRRGLFSTVSVFFLVSIVFLRKITDPDIWYHLTAGREIVKSLRIPQTEIFVYTILGFPGTYNEWGYDALLYLVYSPFGFWGLSLLNGLIAGFVAAALYTAANKKMSRSAAPLSVLAGILLLMDIRFVHRPETILYLFLALEIYLVENFSSSPRWKWLAPIPLLSMCLNLFHPTAAILIIVFLCYVAGWLLEPAQSGAFETRRAVIFLMIALSAAVTSMVNPFGMKQLLLPFMFAGENTYLRGISEFKPIWATTYMRWFILVAVMGLAAIIVQPRGRRITYGLLYLFFGFLALKHVRNFAMFGIVSYMPVAHASEMFVSRLKEYIHPLPNKVFTAAAVTLIAASAWAVTLHDKWGAGPAEGFFPQQSAKFILQHRLKGRIFNFYDLGDYLEWELYPAYLVSVDGRRYSRDRSVDLFEKVFSTQEGWEDILRAYDVSMIITPGAYKASGGLVPLVTELDADPAWSLAVVEPSALLFVRTDLLNKLGTIRAIDKDIIWEHVVDEAVSSRYCFPNETGSYLTLGVADFKLRRFDDAAVQFEKYLTFHPGDSETRQIVQLIRAAEQGVPGAVKGMESLYASGRHKRG
jgi:hypothetical protein